MAGRSWRETRTDPLLWTVVLALVLLRMLLGLLT
jgi:hypothetical protein